MEYKRVKPILYDKGVPKYQASGILNLARVVLPRLAGAAGVAGAAAGAKDYTGPSDQELYDFVFGKRQEAPPIEGYVNYPNYDEIIESQRSDEPIGTIYLPKTHKTSASIPTYARPIPVSYADQSTIPVDTINPGDTIIRNGKKYVSDKDINGTKYLREILENSTPQNPQDKKPEDDKEKDKKNKKFLDTIKKFIYSKGTTTSDKVLQSILWETKGNNWGTILGTNKGLRNLVGRGLIMYPNLLPIVLPEAAERVKTGLKETVNGVVDKVFGPDSTTVTTPATPTTTTSTSTESSDISFTNPNYLDSLYKSQGL